MRALRLAVAGVGNCASALLQGLAHYRSRDASELDGVMHPQIGPYGIDSITPVAAFDVDRRKVGRPLAEALFAEPNCARVFEPNLPDWDLQVLMGPAFDGIAAHMGDWAEDRAFRPADGPAVDVARVLRDSGAQVLVNYLPVGAEKATAHYAEACLEAGVALVNCVPVFIASDPTWAQRFRDADLPIVGDDIKSQLGATIVHRALARLCADRGVRVDRTYQLNTGGNADFLNMLERSRLHSKKISKTESVQSQLDDRLDTEQIHIGPSDYVPWQLDNKVCFIRIEGEGFGGAPVELELRLSVEDSPNSAGCGIDAIRCAGLALDRGVSGPLLEISAYTMKHPPVEMRDSEARTRLESFLSDA